MAKITKSKAGSKVAAGVTKTTKRVGPVDPMGAWTKVQKRTLGSMKKGGKIKKAAYGTTTRSTTIKPTPDSTSYYEKMQEDAYSSAARNMNSPKYADQAFNRAREAGKNIDRQSKKGKPGYDANGFPLKKNKTGGVTKAKDGKWIQKATASIKRRGTEGKCTPITKPGCTGRAKALAKTFKKMAKARKGK